MLERSAVVFDGEKQHPLSVTILQSASDIIKTKDEADMWMARFASLFFFDKDTRRKWRNFYNPKRLSFVILENVL